MRYKMYRPHFVNILNLFVSMQALNTYIRPKVPKKATTMFICINYAYCCGGRTHFFFILFKK